MEHDRFQFAGRGSASSRSRLNSGPCYSNPKLCVTLQKKSLSSSTARIQSTFCVRVAAVRADRCMAEARRRMRTDTQLLGRYTYTLKRSSIQVDSTEKPNKTDQREMGFSRCAGRRRERLPNSRPAAISRNAENPRFELPVLCVNFRALSGCPAISASRCPRFAGFRRPSFADQLLESVRTFARVPRSSPRRKDFQAGQSLFRESSSDVRFAVRKSPTRTESFPSGRI